MSLCPVRAIAPPSGRSVFSVTHTRPCHIIAEMACSHAGKPDLARGIIDAAGRAGADAVQFQIWSLRDMVVPHHPDYPILTEIEMSREEWTDLARHVRTAWPGMEIIACVYEGASVDLGVEIGVDAFKLHSADLSNPDLVARVARTGKRIDLSIGASTLGEIQTAIDWIRSAGDSEIWLMYGYQIFPTPTDAIHMRHMAALRDLFGLRVGYQDHSDAASPAAFHLPAAAVGMGIDVQEKHIALARAAKPPDHQSAFEPDEFTRFVVMIREIDEALGRREPRPFSPEEIRYRKYAKKSLVAARDLAEGQTLTAEDLRAMRADDLGLPPDRIGSLVGRKTRRSIDAFHLLTEADVL
jgi:N,N'-diacetyllegionaminate synthase